LSVVVDNHLKAMMKEAAVEIVRTLRERGHQSYLVGGCVRDLLLGREPADYDVATDATPQQVMRVFARTVGWVPASESCLSRSACSGAMTAGRELVNAAPCREVTRAASRWPLSATMASIAMAGIPTR
jgi:hypothetical protein